MKSSGLALSIKTKFPPKVHRGDVVAHGPDVSVVEKSGWEAERFDVLTRGRHLLGWG